MVNLLESMHKCCLPSGIPSQSPSAYEKSLVHRIFGGRLRSQVRCASCSHCSSKFDPFLDLSLEIADSATLVKALQKFTEEEVLDGGEEQYNCQSCKRKVVAKKRFTIDKAPDVLTIHLKRFSPFNPRHKIDKKVEFQPTLNLKPFVSNSEGMDFRYSLYGVLVHAGWNTQSGHYYCFVRTSSGLWHNLDDNQVRQVREADVLRQKAYMLFYVRDRVRSSVMNTNFIEKKAISEKIACMNDSLRKGLREATMNVSPFINGDMKSQKQNLDNGHPTIFGNSSRGQCTKKPSSIEILEAAAVQNNGMISVQEALCVQPDTVATLSINTNKTTLDSQSEIISPPYLFGESTLDISKAAASAEEVKTKDTAVPDGTMSCCDEAKAAAESVKQHDEIVMDKELPAEYIDAISNTVEQTSVQTNTAEAGQATLKELSVKDTDHITNAEEPVSVQNNNLEALQVNPLKHICSEDSAHVICSEVSAHTICSEASAQATCSEEVSAQATCSEASAHATCSEEVSAQATCSEEVSAQATCSEASAHATCSEASAQAICSEDSAKVLDQVPCHDNPNTRTVLKSDKHVAYSTARLLFVSKQSLLAALKQHKKRKHRRATRQSIDNDELVTDDQQPSTSENVLTRDISCKSHRRRKRSHEKSGSDNGDKMNSKKPHLAEPSSSTADLPMDRKDDKDALLASAELPSLHASSVTDQNDSSNCAHPNEGVSRHFDLLTRGLREITVQRWDDIDTPNTKSAKFPCPRTNIIGYVPDQWDEEYDRGKMKKVRKPKEEEFGGPNPFQEAANIRSRLRKRFKCDQDRWGNQPRRI
ncbi:ubiquitin carboxyl-terminal hydrolase 23-like [Lolium rigidum]|uniref:ubiquitin carboxyl-terminal hydrolase 23-like n=1 Tax=Lolium rigidum TaxID=89674 RepID=UPI001F5E1498|nr:ubiquitin carboxyl-terminal hydrolase 23-like [Lolium rigidum]